jgi:hypothetical protein
MVEWETGEITSEPLNIVAADDPVSCALYARDKNLLRDASWRRFKHIAKRHGKYLREINQAKLKSFRRTPKYEYGYEVPKSYNHAIELDKAAGNSKWQDSVKFELEQLGEYDTFKDHGVFNKFSPPDGYKRIRTHLVFAVKTILLTSYPNIGAINKSGSSYNQSCTGGETPLYYSTRKYEPHIEALTKKMARK